MLELWIKHTCLLVTIALSSVIQASPTPVWTSESGHSVKANLLQLSGTTVKLEKEDGHPLSISLSTFIPSDQKLILEHFGVQHHNLLLDGSDATPLTKCIFPFAEVHGPVTTEGSSYYVYVPKSLKEGRLAPLLFYTNAAGGDTKYHLETLAETSELFGCILAYSIDSSNANGWQNNIKDVGRCMEDLLSKLPIDKNRIHYTGNSGGGNTACLNSSVNKAWGLMPNVAMLPEGLGVDTEVIYATGGATDHNRFLTAHAANLYGENGFHRMSKNGHGDAPVDHRCDGLFWMTCKYLNKYKEKHLEEIKDFERSFIIWLHDMKATNPERSYSNAVILRDVYGMKSENELTLNWLIDELRSVPENSAYHKGLMALNRFSIKHLAPIGKLGWTPEGHAGVEGLTDIQDLRERFGHITTLTPILDGLLEPAPRMK